MGKSLFKHSIVLLSVMLWASLLFAQPLSSIFPKNGYVSGENSISLSWNPVTEVEYYDLKIATDTSFQQIVLDTSNLITSNLKYYPQTNSTYYWKVRSHQGQGVSDWSKIYSFKIFKPTTLNNCKLWLSANLTDTIPGSRIPVWKDHSGFNNNATQLNTTKQPIFTTHAVTGKPVLRFDSINDGMQTSLSIVNGRMSIFAVYSYNNMIGKSRRAIQGLANNYLVGPRANIFNVYAGNFTGGAAVTGFRPVIQRVVQTQSIVKNYINGSLKGSHVNPTYPGTICLGGTGQFPAEVLEGDFFELVVFDDTLTAENYQIAERYLNDKYAPPVNLGPDITYSLCDHEISAGDGFLSYIWSTGQTSKKIETTTSGYYSVTVTDIFGRQSSDSVYVMFHNRKLNINDTTICAGRSVFLSSGLHQGYTFLWSDNSTGDSLLVTQSGQFSVKIIDSLGCYIYTDTAFVHIDDFQAHVTLGEEVALCSGNTIALQAGAGLVSSYLWSTGTTDSILSVTMSGMYSVTVTDINNCEGSDTINVIVSGSAPGIDIVSQDQCLGNAVNFESQVISGDSIISWTWTFGDGDTALIKNPVHLYSEPGNYKVKLQVLSSSGCSNTFVKSLNIFHLPQVHLSLDSACINIETLFRSQVQTFDNDTIITWNWDFGDGQQSNAQSPIHSYSAPGNYYVTLEPMTVKGCIGLSSDTISIVGFSMNPAFFQNIYPFDNQIVTDTLLQFSWTGSGNALFYQLQIATDSLFSAQNIYSTHITTDTFLICQVPALTDLYWRVSAFNLCRDSLVSEHYRLRTFNPSGLAHLKAWYAANKINREAGTKVDIWQDLSGNGMDATNPDIQKQPVLQSSPLNDKPTVSFNGTNEILNTPLLFSNNLMDLIVVSTLGGKPGPFYLGNTSNNGFGFYRNDTTAYGALFGGVTNIKFGNILSKGFQIMELYRAQGATHYLVNNAGGLISNSIPNLPTGQGYIGGVNPTVSFRGNISEILCFDSALSISERNYVFNYLHDKYGPPPVELGPARISKYSLCQALCEVPDNYIHYIWSNGDTTNTTEYHQSGWIKVEATDLFNITTSDSVFISYPFHPLKDTVICTGDTVVLNAWEQKGYTYQWKSVSSGVFSTDSAIRVSQPGIYVVDIEDSLGCQLTDSVRIAIDSFPLTANLGNATASLCQGEMLGLTSGSGEAVTYLWNTGSAEAKVLVESAGMYSVTVTNSRGCRASDSLMVSLHGLVPVANFSAADSVCLGEEIQFTDLSHPAVQDTTAGISGWNWSFGDSSSSGLQHPLHLYQSAGFHTVSLQVVTDSGCVNSIAKDVYVYPLPLANFLTVHGCTGTPVPFSDYSFYPVGHAQGWSWDFGDPGSGASNHSDDSSSVHTYNEAGDFTVTLIISSTTGCMDTVYRHVSILQSPDLDFTFTRACEGDSTRFTNISLLPPWSPVLSSEWDFGDGSPISQEAHPMHLYAAAGTYHVILSVQTLQCRVSLAKEVVVDARPLAIAGASDLCQLTPATFSDLSTVASGQITNWFWDLDILGSSHQADVTLNFPETGTYIIRHSVRSDKGCGSDTITFPIEVFPKPEARFTHLSDLSTTGYQVTFTDQSSEDVLLWQWNFGDGEFSGLQNPVHQYMKEGNYTVNLQVETVHGCSDVSQDTVLLTYPYMDIGISSVFHEINKGFVHFSADLVNLGSRILLMAELNLSINGLPAFKEKWEGSLMPDSVSHYDFHASPAYDATYPEFYYCITAVPEQGTEDVRPSNNEGCEAVTNLLYIGEPYPNPVVSILKLDIILPEEAEIQADVVNSLGEILEKGGNVSCRKGVNHLEVAATALTPGLYTLRLQYHGQVHTRRFVKITDF